VSPTHDAREVTDDDLTYTTEPHPTDPAVTRVTFPDGGTLDHPNAVGLLLPVCARLREDTRRGLTVAHITTPCRPT